MPIGKRLFLTYRFTTEGTENTEVHGAKENGTGGARGQGSNLSVVRAGIVVPFSQSVNRGEGRMLSGMKPDELYQEYEEWEDDSVRVEKIRKSPAGKDITAKGREGAASRGFFPDRNRRPRRDRAQEKF